MLGDQGPRATSTKTEAKLLASLIYDLHIAAVDVTNAKK